MKHLKHLILAMVVLGLSVLAQPAGAQDANRNASDRWEISYFYGGAIGRQIGALHTDCVKLTATFVLDGCNATQDLSDRPAGSGVAGIFPGKGGAQLKQFLTTGGVRPQKGPLNGFRLGFDIKPTWQIEFLVSYAQVDLAIDNREVLLSAQATFDIDNTFPGKFSLLSPNGRNQGSQQLYLGNLVHHFRADKRVVFYVGGGGGMVKWYNGPNAMLSLHKDPRFGLDPRIAAFSKASGDAKGFALNTVGGIKIQATRHFGFRIEAMNIMSFPRFDHQFRTIDVSGQCQAATGADCETLADTPGSFVDLSGHLRQSSTFNYFVVTVGSFIRFGGH
jgi:hypothetical protein